MFWKRIPGRWTGIRKGLSSVRRSVIARCVQKSTRYRAEVTAPPNVGDGLKVIVLMKQYPTRDMELSIIYKKLSYR